MGIGYFEDTVENCNILALEMRNTLMVHADQRDIQSSKAKIFNFYFTMPEIMMTDINCKVMHA